MRRRGVHKNRPVLAAVLAVASVATFVPRSAEAAGADAAPAGSQFQSATADPRLGGHLYSAASPFNQLIPANPQLDPRSAAAVQLLVSSQKAKGFNLALSEWTVPAYFAQQSTTRQDVQIKGFEYVRRVMLGVPIPDNAKPVPEVEVHWAVIDPA